MGLLKNLFSRNESFDLPVSVDMHSHLLPGLDDGSKTIDESLDLISSLMELGYEEFICTPHIMGDYYRNSRDTILPALDQLKEALVKSGKEIPVSAAAEYYIDEWFYEKVKLKEELLTLKDDYLLVETSYMNKPANFRSVLFDLQSSGYKVVIAHPERYVYLFSSFEKFEELYDLKVHFQINLNSLSGHYGKEAKDFAKKLIKNDMVDFVGTDCHGERHVENLKMAMKEKSFGALSQLDLKNNILGK